MVPGFSSLSGLFSAGLTSGIDCETCLGQGSDSKCDEEEAWKVTVDGVGLFSLLLKIQPYSYRIVLTNVLLYY